MAAKQRSKRKGGPYLAAAFFCENVIQDKADDALSAIRIIDSINAVLPPTAKLDCPSEKNPVPIPVTAVLSFKKGDSSREHLVRLVMESPSGKANPPFEQTATFSETEYGGANLIIRSTILVIKGGVFWLNVYLDDKLVTRMPLNIVIQRSNPAPSACTNSG